MALIVVKNWSVLVWGRACSVFISCEACNTGLQLIISSWLILLLFFCFILLSCFPCMFFCRKYPLSIVNKFVLMLFFFFFLIQKLMSVWSLLLKFVIFLTRISLPMLFCFVFWFCYVQSVSCCMAFWIREPTCCVFPLCFVGWEDVPRTRCKRWSLGALSKWVLVSPVGISDS